MIYTVKSVSPDTREWSSKQGGTFVSYTISLEDTNGVTAHGVEWSRKPESRAPQEGEQVAGHLEEGRFGEKFKMDYQATKEIGQGGGGASAGNTSSPPRSSGKEWKPESERDPERSARILRQHSQSAALQYLALTEFAADPANRRVALEQVVKPIIDWFDQDVNQAGQAAIQGAGASATSIAQASSPATTPAPGSPPTEALSDLEMALNETPSGSFMGAEARSLVAKYMQTQLAPDDLSRACNQLTNKSDQEQQEMTFRAMCKRTERWKGQPLPTAPQPDDDIPF